MPSVEMRRTTRVFGARVLRSGRRLFTTPEVIKHIPKTPLAVANVKHDWIELLDHGDVEDKRNGLHKSDEGIDKNVLDINGGESHEGMLVESSKNDLIENGERDGVLRDGDLRSESSRCRMVYTRKRKRSPSSNNYNYNYYDNLDKKFGMKFARKESKKTVVSVEISSDLLQNVPIEPYVVPKSKSRKRKGANVMVAKQTQLNVPNLRPRNNMTINRGIQKRRSSFRSRKQRKSVVDRALFFPIKTNPEVFRSIQRMCVKEANNVMHDIDSASCNASILVIESDRCYRENGAVITLEMLAPNHWFLAVKKDGVERFRVEPRTIMKPCFCNRVTNAIIWAGVNESRKLEFPDRQDWYNFKELYRKCCERNALMKASLASMIPVPRVNEVKGYTDEKYLPFKLPDSYIRLKGDEVSRLLVKSDPVYEMDSEDDEWLNKFNVECDTRVDNDTFEKIIDAYERGIYCSPEDYSDVSLAVDRCLMLASKEVLEIVYDYWMTKRKKKHSALVRVFQFYKPGKLEQTNFKAVFRKKRSFRYRGNQPGRGKQITFLKALSEKNAVEEAENVTIKVLKTEAAANRAEEAAIMKLQRAQVLMEVADLLTYKAAMALKIADARASFGSVDDDDTIDGTLFFGG